MLNISNQSKIHLKNVNLAKVEQNNGLFGEKHSKYIDRLVGKIEQ